MPIFLIAGLFMVLVAQAYVWEAMHGRGQSEGPWLIFTWAFVLIALPVSIVTAVLASIHVALTSDDGGDAVGREPRPVQGPSHPYVPVTPQPRGSTGTGGERTTQLYRLWQATRRHEEWSAFATAVYRDVACGCDTVATALTRYPDAAASPSFADWLRS